MERIEQPFVPEGWEFWLDGGHNSGAAYALANLISDQWLDAKPTYLIFGTTRGRNVTDFVGKFTDVVAHTAFVKINFEPNSYDAEEMLNSVFLPNTSAHESIQAAVKFLHQQNPQPARILCCGSLFMRGDIF
jgi:dihydrofolate synthase/folylpolyglutamate synthase